MNDVIGVIVLVLFIAFLVFIPDVIKFYFKQKYKKKLSDLEPLDGFSMLYVKTVKDSDRIVDFYFCSSSGQVFMRIHYFVDGHELIMPFVEYRGNLPNDLMGEF